MYAHRAAVLFLVDKSCLPRLHQRPFESLGEFRGVADVKGYAMPASTLFADLVRPPSPKVNDIATLIHTEAYPNPLFVVAPPFRDRDWLLFLESHVTIFLIFSVCSVTPDSPREAGFQLERQAAFNRNPGRNHQVPYLQRVAAKAKAITV
jgi:hypothetical protein